MLCSCQNNEAKTAKTLDKQQRAKSETKAIEVKYTIFDTSTSYTTSTKAKFQANKTIELKRLFSHLLLLLSLFILLTIRKCPKRYM